MIFEGLSLKQIKIFFGRWESDFKLASFLAPTPSLRLTLSIRFVLPRCFNHCKSNLKIILRAAVCLFHYQALSVSNAFKCPTGFLGKATVFSGKLILQTREILQKVFFMWIQVKCNENICVVWIPHLGVFIRCFNYL